MIDALFSQTNYAAAKKMLDATALQHEAIASNVANRSTPHYQRVDVNPSFATDLQRAMSSQDLTQIENLQPSLAVDATALASGNDGNTVQLETELLKMNQNTMAHALETQLVTAQLMRLRLAITGRPA